LLKLGARLKQRLHVVQKQRDSEQHLRQATGIFMTPGDEENPGPHMRAPSFLNFLNYNPENDKGQ
jgi:hypothetical protein